MVKGSGDSRWDASTAYSSAGHLIGAGSYNAGSQSDYRNGEYIEIDLAVFLPNDNPHHLYFELYCFDTGSDSFWAMRGDESLATGQDQPVATKNARFYQPLFDPDQNIGQTTKPELLVTRSMGILKLYVREIGLGMLSLVAVDANETALPSGTLGFVESGDWGDDIVITPPETAYMEVGETKEISFTVDPGSGNAFSIGLSSSNNTKLRKQSQLVGELPDGQYSVSGQFFGVEKGVYQVTITVSNAEEGNTDEALSAFVEVNVSEATPKVWPDGVSATPAQTANVQQGGSFGLTANPKNLYGFSIATGDRWGVVGSGIQILGQDTNSATFYAAHAGEHTITYTMYPADGIGEAVRYETIVTVGETATEDLSTDLYIGDDREILEGQNLSVRAAENTPYNSSGTWSADDPGIVFNSPTARITSVTTPGPGDYVISRLLDNLDDPGSPSILKTFALKVREVFDPFNVRGKYCAEPKIVLEIETDSGSVYIKDGVNDLHPPGAVVLNCLLDAAGVSSVSQRINTRKGSSDIGTFTATINEDADYSFAGWVNSLLVAGGSLKDCRVKAYRFCEGDEWDASKLWKTHVFDSFTAKDKQIKLKTRDVQRYMQSKVFEPSSGRLVESLTDNSTHLRIKKSGNVSAFERFQHSDDYQIHPGQAVSYVYFSKTGEVIAVDQKIEDVIDGADDYRIIQRGVFGTTKQDIEISADTEDDNLPLGEEFIYLEGSASELAHQVATGKSRDGAITLPEHWHAHVPPDLIDINSFNSLGDEVESIRLRFPRLKKQTAKDFIEQQLYFPARITPYVNSSGAVRLRRSPSTSPDAAFVGTLTADDVVSVSDLKTDFGTIKTGLIIEWGWNWYLEKYTNPTLIIDSDAVSQHGYTEYEKVSFKGLHSATHTESTVRSIADYMRGLISHESLWLTVQVMPDRDFYDAGDVVRLKDLGDIVKDPSSVANINLDRSMSLISRNENPYTGDVTYQFFGIGRKIVSTASMTTGSNVSDVFLLGDGENLADYVTIVDGEIQGANSLPAGVYSYDGDLSHSAVDGQIIQSTPGTIELRVTGSYSPLHPESIVTVGMGQAGGLGQMGGGPDSAVGDGRDPTAGVSGYFGNAYSANGVAAQHIWREAGTEGVTFNVTAVRKVKSTPAAPATIGKVTELPVFPLSVTDGVLSGYPKDISGSGSPGSGAWINWTFTSSYDQTLIVKSQRNGRDGVSGGGGIIIVSRGGSTGANGGFNTSGAAGIPGLTTTTPTYYSGTSAGGCPGAVLWMVDGDHFLPELDGRVIAKSGAADIPPASQIKEGEKVHVNYDRAPYRPNVDPSPELDYSGVCVSVQYIPADSTPQEGDLYGELSPYLQGQLSEIREMAESQLDDESNVFVQNNKPSFGLEGDFWVNIAARDGEGYPDVYVHDGADYAYVDPSTSMFVKVLRQQYGNTFIAEGKGAVYYNLSTEAEPTPKSESDVWVQPDTGKWFRTIDTGSELIWDRKAFADEYYAPTGSDIIPDPVFEQYVNDGRLTWLYGDTFGGEISPAGVSEADISGYGEGGSPGVRVSIPSDHPNVQYDATGLLTPTQFFPAAVGDFWRVSIRAATWGPLTSVSSRFVLFNADKELIGYVSAASGQRLQGDNAQNGKYRTCVRMHSINPDTQDWTLFNGRSVAEVSFFKPAVFCSLDHDFDWSEISLIHVDMVRCELIPSVRDKVTENGPVTIDTALDDILTLEHDFGAAGKETRIEYQFMLRSTESGRNIDVKLTDGNNVSIAPGGGDLAEDFSIDWTGWQVFTGSVTIDAGDEIESGVQTVKLRMSANNASGVQIKNARLYVV